MTEGFENEDWLRINLPDSLAGADAMLYPEERKLLYYSARDYYTGEGEIVDAGSFLGGSAICLSEGLRANPRVTNKAKRIHSFDRFKCHAGFPRKWFAGTDIKDGDSIRPIFDRNTAPYIEHLDVSEGDIRHAKWDQPIEILFLDICKNVATTDHMTEHFFPRLIPGKSVVIQQDYLLPSWNIWIIATMEALRPYFRRLTYVFANSVVYLCEKEVPPLKDLMGNTPDIEKVRLATRAAEDWEGSQKAIVNKSIQLFSLSDRTDV